jgi:PAS domain S-box-containing protein
LVRTAKPYIVAISTVATATALRLALIPVLGPHRLPFLTYFAAILLAAWFGGMSGGITASVLSIIAAHYAFVAPQLDAFPSPIAASAALAVFGLDIALILYINYAYRRATAEQEEHEKQISAQLRAMETLNAVGQRCLTAGNNLEDSLAEFLEAAISLTGASMGNVQLFDASSDGLRLVAHRGFQEPFLKFFEVVSTQGSVCEMAMKKRARAIVSDVAGSEALAGTPAQKVLLEAGVRAVQSTPLISSSGNLLGMISTHYTIPTEPTGQQLALVDLLARQIADLLERKRAERALRASELQLRQFVNAVPTGIARRSRDLRYLDANPAYAAIFEIPLDQIVGRSTVDVLGREAWEIMRPAVERVLNGERVEYEAEVVPSGATGARFLHFVYTPERNEQGEVIGWISSVTDMTDFQQAKENLTKLEKLAAVGQLAATLAHEINNPLNSVVNCLYLLQTGAVGEETRITLIDSASAELARLARIVKQSLSYYRAGNAEQVDLALLIRDSLQIFSRKFENAGIRVTEKVDSTPAILGFPDELRQVIDNLLLNAIEAMPKGGKLGVAVHSCTLWRSGTSGVRVTIADTGSGMPADIQEKIFDPFFTTKTEKGTGLGLWVVKGILSKHGATVRVRSSSRPERTGTVFSFFCPTPASSNAKAAKSREMVAS